MVVFRCVVSLSLVLFLVSVNVDGGRGPGNSYMSVGGNRQKWKGKR